MIKHRIHHVIHHGVDFLILFILLALGFGALLYFQHNIAVQIVVAVIMAGSYALWGIIHHYHEGSLTSEVILEYIAISTLVGFILVIFLLRV